jgi:hypothetical protein
LTEARDQREAPDGLVKCGAELAEEVEVVVHEFENRDIK